MGEVGTVADGVPQDTGAAEPLREAGATEPPRDIGVAEPPRDAGVRLREGIRPW